MINYQGERGCFVELISVFDGHTAQLHKSFPFQNSLRSLKFIHTFDFTHIIDILFRMLVYYTNKGVKVEHDNYYWHKYCNIFILRRYWYSEWLFSYINNFLIWYQKIVMESSTFSRNNPSVPDCMFTNMYIHKYVIHSTCDIKMLPTSIIAVPEQTMRRSNSCIRMCDE